MKTHSVAVLLLGLVFVQLITENKAACRNRWKVFSMAACKRSGNEATFKDYVSEFRMFDLNDDGVITTSEIVKILHFLQNIDKDGDGSITLREYVMDAEGSTDFDVDV